MKYKSHAMIDSRSQIEKAVAIIKDGGIVIFPTDTAFGIGCRIDSDEAIKKLFSIRQRPRSQATPVLVSSIAMAQDYFLNPSEVVLRFMSLFWPGALTIVSFCDEHKVNSYVRGGGSTIGLRMPNHESTLSIIENVGVPILGPSANFHGHETPYTYSSLDSNLTKLVDFVVEGVCNVGLASTVVDCSRDPHGILRQGSVHLES